MLIKMKNEGGERWEPTTPKEPPKQHPPYFSWLDHKPDYTQSNYNGKCAVG